MKSICTGWEFNPHAAIVLRDNGVDDGKVSHGCCATCEALLHAALDEEDAKVGREVAERVNRYTRSF